MKPVEALLRLDDRVALVTGAGGGIGGSIAQRLAAAGAHVFVHFRTSREAADSVVADIVSAGGHGEAISADLTEPSDVAALFSAIAEGAGGPDVLVNNAGIYPVQGILDMSTEEWDDTIDANLKSVFLCTRAAAPAMEARGGGSIVNIASIEGQAPASGHSHYSSAKAAVRMHGRAAAQEFGPLGIRVNTVSPGLIHRDGIEEAWPEGVERWLAACPLGRLGHPTDVADACLFFASDASRWITGSELVVDGGTLTGGAF